MGLVTLGAVEINFKAIRTKSWAKAIQWIECNAWSFDDMAATTS